MDRIAKVNKAYNRTVEFTEKRHLSPNRQNGTNQNDDVTCQQVDSQTVEIHLGNACDGQFLIRNCPPLFISIEGLSTAAVPSFRCSDDSECRFPDSVRFGINHENLGCFSSAGRLIGAISLIILSIFFAASL